MVTCEECLGKGIPSGCTSCGTVKYGTVNEKIADAESPFPIPTYYKRNLWSEDKIMPTDNDFTRATLNVLNKLVSQVVNGQPIQSSFVFLLPNRFGKRTAMYTMIQAYLEQGLTVAPPIDIATLAIVENHFSAKDKSIVSKWETLVSSDFLCVYGVDFSARYQTMNLFTNLCTVRALQNKPTILFAQSTLADLKSFYDTVDYSEEYNVEDVCKLSNPYIMDGVVGGS